ncbi:cbb3-type cytochrome c oxidase subunit I [Paenibacillus cremeus]|uniref:Cbb3-type cytochrome c oxidase subunit I n=1 Tax=Paenibacillus cremeus TaxID=2163881 RepID=A0A559KBJ0_9BACL|nr:cbb3-type cytochrome c oxidase subunit I [Paenibacillus cremeus]TVY09496.1 cbb3-type cytochrome c oxidase subunit I [Paenibacillus cremeus]
MAKNFLRIAAVYFCIGVIIGITMGIVQDFRLASVHAHFNLLGWVSMALFGLIYHFYPQAADTKLAKTHFWLHNICLPLMQGGLAVMLLTNDEKTLLPLVIVSSLLLVIGVLLFTVNLFRALASSSAKKEQNNSIGA